MQANAEVQETNQVPILDGKWVAEIEVSSFMKGHPEDKRIPVPDRPLVVPVRWWSQVLGAQKNEISFIKLSERETTPQDYGYVSIEQSWRLVSDEPFIAVHFREHDEWHGKAATMHRHMTTSRQIHKGELGRRPELIRKPQILVSEIQDPDNGHWDHSNPFDPKYIRPNLNWVELSELSSITGLKPEEIIGGFAGFSPSTWYQPNVPLLRGMLRREDIFRIYTGAVPQTFCGGEYYWGEEKVAPLSLLQRVIDDNDGKVWVPQRFAYNVIRLVQFGYRPENETPENSFCFEAPMPTPPEAKLPVLSVEELRELHPLHMQLPHELPEIAFRQAAEKVIGSYGWKDSKEMDDPEGGVGKYNMSFKRLDFDTEDGNLMISTCYWTRAGADKSSNYYAGMLAVFPKQVADPRRDPSAILRIWFFPDQLQRLTPTGSKGGICPPEVPTDMAERVKRFLTSLGYSL